MTGNLRKMQRGVAAMGSFEGRKPDACDDCVALWGVRYCRLVGKPCARVEECPEGRGKKDD